MGLLGKKPRQDLRGRWSDVFSTLSIVLGCYFLIRWAVIEPFVIPSGSMKPTLLVQDYVIVNKFGFGLRIPFTDKWLLGPYNPSRGDVIVFRAKDEDYHFMVKRVVGLPGDTVLIDENGQVLVNGELLRQEAQADSENYYRFTEHQGSRAYTVQYEQEKMAGEVHEIEVPTGHIFMMGDNRDHSMDSRYWGSLPMTRILGQASVIWMSCEDSEKMSTFLCPPENFRWERIFKVIR